MLFSKAHRRCRPRLSKGMGAGGNTDAPSWLMLGAYPLEALAIAGPMTLAALLSSPSTENTEETDGEGAASEGQEPNTQQAA